MSADLYVYALATTADEASLGTGIDDHPLRVIASPGRVHAVVHEHGGAPYEGADDDVRRWVLEHSDVVEQVASAGPVLPVSFNVIVADTAEEPAAQRLQAWLTENAEVLSTRLEQLRGRVELRVEIALDVAALTQDNPELVQMRAEAASRPAGVQRLLRKRAEQREREVADSRADELYPEYRGRLAGLAEDLVENRGSRAEEGQVPVASFALLVPEAGTHDVGAALAQILESEPAARIRFLGPWPPYSFADVPQLTTWGARGSEAEARRRGPASPDVRVRSARRSLRPRPGAPEVNQQQPRSW